jgi:undecaprenyl-phosphate 4-deoxy-4-formamido-L-arabinose transferase
VAVVTPVVAASTTLHSLVDRLAAALGDVDWRLRLVVDASPGPSVRSAHELAAADERIAVTGLTVAAGPPAVLLGLAAEEDADVWVCLEADRADPPEAVPLLLDRLAHGDVEAVLAVRRTAGPAPRRLVDGLRRRISDHLARVPLHAEAPLAMGPDVRAAVLAAQAPTLLMAVGRAGRPVATVPVGQPVRPVSPALLRSALWVLRDARRR